MKKQGKKLLLENHVVRFEYFEGVVFGTFKVKNIDKENALFSIESRIKATKKIPHSILIDIKNIKTVTKEAREIFSSEISFKYLKSTAILVKSPFSAAIANLYLKINKPRGNVRIFPSEKMALTWLKSRDF